MVTERLLPTYCPKCMHWASTHGPDGCMYRGCQCDQPQAWLRRNETRG